MKQVTKYIGMLAIAAMFAIATVSGSINEAEAKLVRDKHVVQAEAELDVDLSVKQIFEPRKADTGFKTTKGFTPASSDSDVITYKVVYRIQNDGATDVKNVIISVQSDTETVDAKLSGKLDVKHSTITVLVKAVDSALLDAKIVGYEI